jgi:hypothetical protein
MEEIERCYSFILSQTPHETFMFYLEILKYKSNYIIFKFNGERSDAAVFLRLPHSPPRVVVYIRKRWGGFEEQQICGQEYHCHYWQEQKHF